MSTINSCLILRRLRQFDTSGRFPRAASPSMFQLKLRRPSHRRLKNLLALRSHSGFRTFSINLCSAVFLLMLAPLSVPLIRTGWRCEYVAGRQCLLKNL